MFLSNLSTQQYLFFTKNQKYCSGIPNEVLLSKGISYVISRIHKDEQLTIINSFELVRTTLKTLGINQLKNLSIQYNYRWKHANGNYINLVDSKTPIEFTDTGEPIIWFGQVRVIGDNEIRPPKVICRVLNEKNTYNTILDVNVAEYEFKKSFSPREIEILDTVNKGLKNQDIADKLFISYNTVKTHRKNIHQKIKDHNLESLLKISGLSV